MPLQPNADGPAFGLFPGAFRAISLGLARLQAESSHALAAFMEDQPVEVVGKIAKGQLRFGSRQSDGANEQPEPVLLMGKDMLDMSTDRGFRSVGPRSRLRHGLAH